MIEAQLPELPHPLTVLRESLGKPTARLDYQWGFVSVPAGEWVYAARGITLFLNTDRTLLTHVAVYAPTDLETYREELRLNLEKKRLPRRPRR